MFRHCPGLAEVFLMPVTFTFWNFPVFPGRGCRDLGYLGALGGGACLCPGLGQSLGVQGGGAEAGPPARPVGVAAQGDHPRPGSSIRHVPGLGQVVRAEVTSGLQRSGEGHPGRREARFSVVECCHPVDTFQKTCHRTRSALWPDSGGWGRRPPCPGCDCD